MRDFYRWLSLGAMFILLLMPIHAFGQVDNTPIVVFRVDDAPNTWLTKFNGLGGVSAFDYGKSKHIPITWGIISAFANNGAASGSLSWAQLQDYLDTCGGEAASHSVHHTAMSTQQDYVDDIVNSQAAINDKLHGHPCTTFLQPGTWIGDAYLDSNTKLDKPIGKAIQQKYNQSQAYLGSGWLVGSQYYTHGLTNTIGLDFTSVTAVQKALDFVAATPGLVYVVSAHGVCEQGQVVPYKTPANIIKAFMNELYDLRDHGKIRIMGLSDAYHALFSADLNHIPDPGFELTDPGSTTLTGPWWPSQNYRIIAEGGVSNSRYAAIGGDQSYIQSGYLVVGPGRYLLSWYQRPEASRPPAGPLNVEFTNITRGSQWSPLPATNYWNLDPSKWERNDAVVWARDRWQLAQITLTPAADSAYGIDNLSLVEIPFNPALSPSNTTITPTPGHYKITWHTPLDPAIASIRIQCSGDTVPLNPTDGQTLAEVEASRGNQQQITGDIDWTQSRRFCFAVFAIRSDGTASSPDLVIQPVDRMVSVKPAVSASISGNDTVTTRISDVVGWRYQYAAGTRPGTNDIKDWICSEKMPETLIGMPVDTMFYASAKYQNEFGIWSEPGVSTPLRISSITAAAWLPDDSAASVRGTVSAVFGDCFYLQDSGVPRGIRILGAGYQLGDMLSVTGKMTTAAGERAISPRTITPVSP